MRTRFVLLPLVLLAALIGFVVVFAVTRIVSASSLTAALIAPLAALWLGHVQQAELFLVLAAIVWFQHRSNLVRLLRGEEKPLTIGRR